VNNVINLWVPLMEEIN